MAIANTTPGANVVAQAGSDGKLASGFLPIDTDEALTANSDTVVPSQQAVKAYVDSSSASVSDDTTLGGGTPSATSAPSQNAVQQYVTANAGGGGMSNITGRFYGTDTWTVPAGVTRIKVRLWGSGGGGGYGSTLADGKGGYGGGSGSYTEDYFDVTPGQVYDLVCGVGGAGGDSTTIDGSDGTTTSITLQGSGTALIIATGGKGGLGNLLAAY